MISASSRSLSTDTFTGSRSLIAVLTKSQYKTHRRIEGLGG